jgi:uncharacterized nucleotidyltransferase DUF6036
MSALPGSWPARVRELTDEGRLRRFMRALGHAAVADGDCYLAGGATAVLLGWRATTLDVDLRLEPEQDELFGAIASLKDELSINVELASPADFIPLPDGWRDRSIFVTHEGRITFRHFDPYSQALAKLERGHSQDLGDVRELLDRGLVEPERLRAAFDEIEPRLDRFPAVDPPSFRRAVEHFLASR